MESPGNVWALFLYTRFEKQFVKLRIQGKIISFEAI